MQRKNNSSQLKKILLYIGFGVLTTVVNIFLFWFLADFLKMQYLVSNFLAIVVTILVAYITNKVYVFKSVTNNRRELFKEFMTFLGARVGTLIFDMVGMFVLVSFLNVGSLISKILVNIVVVVLNYVFSQLLVFKNGQ